MTKLALGFSGYGDKEVSPIKMILAVYTAIKHGVRKIDVAPHYGNGSRESVLGVALLGLPVNVIEQLEISTKVGRVIDTDCPPKANPDFKNANTFSQHFDYTRKGILESFKQSQHRLGLHGVHTLYLHDLDELTHGADYSSKWAEFFDLGENSGYLAFEDLKQQGKIKQIGIGSNDVNSSIKLIEDGRFKPDRIMLAGGFNLLNFHALNRLFPLCHAKEIKISIAAPYCGGLLSGEKGNLTYKYKKADKETLKRVERIQKICDQFEVSLPHAAIQMVCQHPQVEKVIVGCRTKREFIESFVRTEKQMSSQFWDTLKNANLIDYVPIASYF